MSLIVHVATGKLNFASVFSLFGNELILWLLREADNVRFNNIGPVENILQLLTFLPTPSIYK